MGTVIPGTVIRAQNKTLEAQVNIIDPSPSPSAAKPLDASAVNGCTLRAMARNPGASDLGPCEACGSVNVVQIRTSRRNVEIAVGNGIRLQFKRLYLDRCEDCRHVVMSGKTPLGAFAKNYLPDMAGA
jgi:hypothetical protein